MIFVAWPHVDDFFLNRAWKIYLAQILNGQNLNLDEKLYPSIEFFEVIYLEIIINKQNKLTDIWSKAFNFAIAKRILLEIKNIMLIQYEKLKFATINKNIDSGSLKNGDLPYIYKIFIDNISVIRTISDKIHTIKDAISFIDQESYNKIHSLPNNLFINYIFAGYNGFIEKIDVNLNELKKEADKQV
jgi:hypothetical protein